MMRVLTVTTILLGMALAIAGCATATKGDAAVVKNLERYAALMRETESNAWPVPEMIEEGVEKLRKQLSGGTSGSVYLGINPSQVLQNYASLLSERGQAAEAKEMEALADLYKAMQIQNVKSHGAKIMDINRYYAPK